MADDSLDISNQGLKEFPSKYYAHFACQSQLSEVVILDLSKNCLSHLPGDIFFHLCSLRKLSLGNNRLTALPPDLASTTTLQILHAEGNALSSLIALPASLVHLNLSKNKLSELPPSIFNLPLLTKLNVSNNSIRIIPTEIKYLERLEILDTSYNNIHVLPDALKNLGDTLKYLNLSNNFIASLPEDMDHLHSLEILSLDHNKLSALPAAIPNLTKLRILHVDNNEIMSGLPTCNRLLDMMCRDNRLRALPNSVGDMAFLQRLDVSRNNVGILPREIGLLEDIMELNLRSNKLLCIPPEIGSLRKLLTIDLAHNNLAILPNELCQLRSLRTLDVSNNSLSALPVSIGSLSNLQVLDVSYNNIASFPESSKLWTDMTSINASHNQIEDISGNLCLELTKLSTLNLCGNKLDHLPMQFNSLVQRGVAIDVDSNPLTLTFELHSQRPANGQTENALDILRDEAALHSALLLSAGWNADRREHSIGQVSIDQFASTVLGQIQCSFESDAALLIISHFYFTLRDVGDPPEFHVCKQHVVRKTKAESAESDMRRLARAQKAREDDRKERLRVHANYFNKLLRPTTALGAGIKGNERERIAQGNARVRHNEDIKAECIFIECHDT